MQATAVILYFPRILRPSSFHFSPLLPHPPSSSPAASSISWYQPKYSKTKSKKERACSNKPTFIYGENCIIRQPSPWEMCLPLGILHSTVMSWWEEYPHCLLRLLLSHISIEYSTEFTLTNTHQEHWDADSPLSKNEQKRSLVDKWIRLGRYGRNVKLTKFLLSFPYQIKN